MVPTMNKNEHFSVSCLNELKLVGVDWYDIRSVPTPQVVWWLHHQVSKKEFRAVPAFLKG